MIRKTIFWTSLLYLTLVISLLTAQTTIWEETFAPAQPGWTLQNNWSFQTGFMRFSYLPATPNFDLSALSPLINLPDQPPDLIVSHYYNDYLYSYDDEFLQIIVISGTVETVLWNYDTLNGTWGSFGGEDLELSLADFAGQDIQLKFRVFGGSTYNLNNWNIYNISVFFSIDNDLEAVDVSGSVNPVTGVETEYVVSVRNNGLLSQNDYTVQLMQEDDTVLSTVTGVSIDPNQIIDYTFSHTFLTSGPTYIWGKVLLDGDQMPMNNATSHLLVTVLPEGTSYTSIGDANTTAYTLPLTFWLNSSISQSIYFADEFDHTYGMISAIEYFNSFVADLPDRSIKIWMAQVLEDEIPSGYLPYGEFTLVFEGTIDFPSGDNTIFIPLQEEFLYSYGNLVVMAQRVFDPVSNNISNHFYYTNTPEHQNRTRSNWSDSAVYDPGNLPSGNAYSRVPNTGFYFSESYQLVNDMAAISITGNLNPSLNQPADYTVTVKNNGSSIQDEYVVKLMTESGIELASTAVTTPLQQFEELDVVLSWTPQFIGPATIYGEVVLIDDEVADNNVTQLLNVYIQEAGVTAISIGTNTTLSNNLPMNFNWRNSLSQTIYMADELDLDNGLLTEISYYNSFLNDLPNREVRIWITETTQSSLPESWLEYDQFTEVFNGFVHFPAGENEINIPLDTYYNYNGGNLIIMVNRVFEGIYWHTSDRFYYSETPEYPARSRWYSSDTAFDLENMNFGSTAGAAVPNTTLYFYVLGTGSLSGTVYNDDLETIADVSISIIDTDFSILSDIDGSYSFPHLFAGTHSLIASKFGYYETILDDIEIVESLVTVQDITMQAIPTVSLSGLVVGSDFPDNGIAQAEISLAGYDSYSTITDDEGFFTFENVYSNQVYLLKIISGGYSSYEAEIVIEESNIDLGVIVINETPYAPYNLSAVLELENAVVDLTWNSPSTIDSYFSDFEDNNGGWTSGSITGNDIWEWGVPNQTSINNAHSGNKVWMTSLDNNYVNNLNIWLKSPEIDLSEVNEPYFSVWLNIHTENGFDGMILESSTDNGTTWQRVEGDPGFYNNSSAWGDIPPPRWSGLIGFWQPFSTFIPELSNQPSVYFRFRFQTSHNNVFHEGIAIDDVYIGPEPLPDFPDNILGRSQTGLGKNLSHRNLSGINPIKTDASEDRVLEMYLVYRMLQGQEYSENLWQEIGTVLMPDTTFTDTGFPNINQGIYRYAVKAVYTNGVFSQPAFSNVIVHNLFSQVTVYASTNSGDPVTGAVVTLTNQNDNPEFVYTQNLLASGFITFPQVLKGFYQVSVSLAGFEDYIEDDVEFTANSITHLVDLIEALLPVQNLTSSLNVNNVTLEWQHPYLSFREKSPSVEKEVMQKYKALMTTGRDKFQAAIADTSEDESNSRALLGYNIIRNDDIIAANVAELTYTDQDLEDGVYVYGVQAVYTTGLSEAVYTDEIQVETSHTDLTAEPSLINKLYSNYPNPFNPVTTIDFSIEKSDHVLIEIYNVSGRRVRTLLSEKKEAGRHSVVWDGKTDSNQIAGSGVYFYRIASGSYTSSRKMILLK